MSIVFDSKERIARSNIYSIFGKLLRRCTQKNDNGDILLFEAGLSSLVEEYSFRLNPHWFNRCRMQCGWHRLRKFRTTLAGICSTPC